MGDSQASFSLSVMNKIRETYESRCVICLSWLNIGECAHILGAAAQGKYQLLNAVRLGVLQEGFERNADTNALLQCPNCQSLFTKNRVVLSLPIPVLKYLERYVKSTRKVLKPLYEVFDILVDALDGKPPVGIPNPDAILPYIGLFTLVTLDPAAVARTVLITPHVPSLSIINNNNNQFEDAPADTLATAENVARIFDSSEIKEDDPFNLAIIPLAPGVAGFEEKRYWRIPVFAGTIFAALIARLEKDLSESEDIVLARKVVGHLMVKNPGGNVPSGGPSGGRGTRVNGCVNGRGGGRIGGGGAVKGGTRGKQSKRKNVSDEGSSSSEMMARRLADRDGASPLASSVPLWNVGVPPGAPSQSDTPAMDTNHDDSDSGRSISAIDPPNEDNPDRWRFGPSFSTNKIVFTARAVRLR